MQWHCIAIDHEPLTWDNKEGLQKHMEERHRDEFSSKQISTIVDVNARPIEPVIDHCPFCAQTRMQETTQDAAQKTAGFDLEAHVGQHLQKFALQSLPPVPSDDCASSKPGSIEASSQPESIGSANHYLEDIKKDTIEIALNASPVDQTEFLQTGVNHDSLWVPSDEYTKIWSEIVREERAKREFQYDDIVTMDYVEHEESSKIRNVTSVLETAKASTDHRHEQQSYTPFSGQSSLAVSTSRHPEIISDAGDQIFRRSSRQAHTSITRLDMPGPAKGVIASSAYDLEAQISSLEQSDVAEGFGLQKRILDALKQSRSTTGIVREFLPKGELDRLLDVATVTQELRQALPNTHSTEQIREFAEIICRSAAISNSGDQEARDYRKVFVLLILVEMASHFPIFLEQNVSDCDLPLNVTRDRDRPHSHQKDHLNVLLRCFERWSPIKLRNFQEYQWKVLAPIFSTDDVSVRHYSLLDQHVLPFTEPAGPPGTNITDKFGGYGKVLMVDIHPDHQNFSANGLITRGFAIKQQLYEEDRRIYKKEIAVLKHFCGPRKHKHVISLLATYEQSHKLNLIYHRAEGELFDLWKMIDSGPKLSHKNIIWIAEQCAGLTGGLRQLHQNLVQTDDVDKENVQSDRRGKLMH
jgi:hypothetical protein